MATYVTQGAWAPNSGTPRRMCIRITWTMSDPAPGDTSVHVGVRIEVGGHYRFWDSAARYARSGTFGSYTDTRAVQISTSGGWALLEEFSDTFPLRPQGYDIDCAASLTGVDYIGGDVKAIHESTLWIPPQGSARPNAPSPGAYYVSDRQIRIEWPAVPLADRYRLERWVESDKAWSRIGTVYGTSYTDYGVWENDQFRYRVDAWSGSLDSPWGESGYIRTTPAAPALAVTRESGNLRVTLTHNARYPQRWQLERRVNNGEWRTWLSGGDGAAVGTMTPQPGETWQFRGRTGTGVGAELWSTWAVTDQIPALAAPLAPTLIAPRGVAPSDDWITFRWQHNPVDRSQQTAAEIRYRTGGEASWRPAEQVAGDASMHRLRLPAGQWLWQARTRGAHADWGPWSEAIGFYVTDSPHIKILTPTAGDVVESSRLVATYEADGGSYQTRALEAAITDVATGRQVATWTDDAVSGRTESPPILKDGGSYRLEARVLAWSGLWSQWVDVAFRVDYADPATPTISARWVEEEGVVVATAKAGTKAGAPDTVAIAIEVSRDGEATWQLLDRWGTQEGAATDPRPDLASTVAYRTRAISNLPSEAVSEPIRVGTPTCRIWVTPADGAPGGAWAADNLKIETAWSAAATVLEQYEGSPLPTAHFGLARPIEVAISGDLPPEEVAPIQSWIPLIGRHVWLRTPRGHHMHGVLIGDIRTSDETDRPLVAFAIRFTATTQAGGGRG